MSSDEGTGREDGGRTGSGHPRRADTAESASLRDARAIAARIAADEAAADAERARLAHAILPALAADLEGGVRLQPGEVLHAERRSALIEAGAPGLPRGGVLYLTSHRLIHVAADAVEGIELARIADMAVAMERLLLIELTDGSDLALEVDQPRLLRVQVAAARAARRASTREPRAGEEAG